MSNVNPVSTESGSAMAAADSRRALAELDLVSGARLSAQLKAHFQVVRAIFLRDIQTRVAGTRFGFLISMFQPLSHIGIMLTIYYILGRRAPIGTEATIFLATGALPFVVWLYGFRHVKTAPIQNSRLTYYPGVTVIDLLIARSGVELLASACICIFTLGAISLFGFDVVIFNPPMFVFAMFQAYLLGIAFGFLFAVLGLLSMFWLIIGGLLGPLFWMTSGVLFIPSMLPEQLQDWVWYLPISQIVDHLRTAYYGHYISDFYSGYYIAGVILGCFSLSIIMMQVFRTKLSEAI